MAMIQSISIRDFRGYAALDATFGAGPQLVVGPNAAGKTSLLEAIVLVAWGRSHRTSVEGEMIRWGADLGDRGAEGLEGGRVGAHLPLQGDDADLDPRCGGRAHQPRSANLMV